jgi:DNA-binding GntR family transcriptional regulator
MQTEIARRRLRELILDGTYAHGARLTEVDAAATLAMSRTPVREALHSLAADGLVRATGRGVVVVALDADALAEAYQVRSMLEALTAELAAARQRDGRIAPADLASLYDIAADTVRATSAGRLDEAIRNNRRFHRRIAELAGNAIALQTLDRLWDQIQVSTLRSLTPPARPAQVTAQHDDLVSAIAEGRSDDAGRIARQHVVDTRAAAVPNAAVPNAAVPEG